jgi:bacterioferritin-associated ferredoxin
MEPDDEVCLCFRVTRRKLESFVRVRLPRVASQLSECNGAGTGCGWCVPVLKKIFEKGSAEGCPAAVEYAAARAKYREGGPGQ